MTTTKDALDKNNKLKAIEFYDDNGDFIFQAMWDERDDHTPEKIAAFRKWADTMAARLDNKNGAQS